MSGERTSTFSTRLDGVPPFGGGLRRRRASTLGLLALAAAGAYLTRHALAVANTSMQAELGIDNERFGWLYGAFSLGYLVFQIPGGWLGQRIGTRAALAALSALWSLATVATAMAATVPALVAARFAFGAAQAGLVPNQAKIVKDWFPERSRGSASAVLVMAMSLGGVAGLALTSQLMIHFPWRTVLALYSLYGVVWSVLFFAMFRTRPWEFPELRGELAAESKGSGSGSGSGVGEAEATATAGRGNTFALMARRPDLIALGVQALFKAAAYNFLVTFYPAVLEYAHDLPADRAGFLTSWALGGVIAGSWFGGRLVDGIQRRTGDKRLSRSGLAAGSMLIAALTMALAAKAPGPIALAGLMTLAAFASGLGNACPWAATIDIGGERSAIVMGYMNSCAALAGILLSPPVGRLVDHVRAADGDWATVILLHAGFYLAAAAAWLLVDPRRSLDDPPRAGPPSSKGVG